MGTLSKPLNISWQRSPLDSLENRFIGQLAAFLFFWKKKKKERKGGRVGFKSVRNGNETEVKVTEEEEERKMHSFVISVQKTRIFTTVIFSVRKKFRVHFVLFDLYLFFQLGILNSTRRHPSWDPRQTPPKHLFAMSGDPRTGVEADARSQARCLPDPRPAAPPAGPLPTGPGRGPAAPAAPRRGHAMRTHVRGHSARPLPAAPGSSEAPGSAFFPLPSPPHPLQRCTHTHVCELQAPTRSRCQQRGGNAPSRWEAGLGVRKKKGGSIFRRPPSPQSTRGAEPPSRRRACPRRLPPRSADRAAPPAPSGSK